MMNLVRPPLVCPANRGFALNSRIPGRIRATLTPAQEIDLTALETAIQSDWGFFVPYLIGSISLIVLAVGSISPGLLQAGISGFSSIFPDYQERVTSHEAAHFLVAYLLGQPVLGYSLDIGNEHVNLIDERLQKLIYGGQLDAKELDRMISRRFTKHRNRYAVSMSDWRRIIGIGTPYPSLTY